MASYHHGNLSEALLDAAEVQIEAVGLEALSIRACAKAIGVTHSAAFRHYKNKRHLLTALATRSAHRMADAIQLSAEKTAQNKGFLETGLSYIDFAIQNPQQFRSVFREELIDADDGSYRLATARLAAQLGDGREQRSQPEPISEAALLAWSTVHGLACLSIDGSLESDISKADRMQFFRKTLQRLGPVLER